MTVEGKFDCPQIEAVMRSGVKHLTAAQIETITANTLIIATTEPL